MNDRKFGGGATVLTSTSLTTGDATWNALRTITPPYATFAFFHCAGDDDTAPPALPGVEATAVVHAVASRQREFAHGRACARAALALIDVPAVEIPVGADRAPIWPRGARGSISHCEGFIGAVAASANACRGAGLDVERVQALDPEVVRLVCSPLEREGTGAAHDPLVYFSAKEAVHKCIAPLTGRTLDFCDVTLALTDEGFTVEPASPAAIDVKTVLRAITGRIARTPSHVFTAAWIAASGAARGAP